MRTTSVDDDLSLFLDVRPIIIRCDTFCLHGAYVPRWFPQFIAFSFRLVLSSEGILNRASERSDGANFRVD